MAQKQKGNSPITLYKSETEFLKFEPEDDIGFIIFYFRKPDGSKLEGSVSLYKIGVPSDLRSRMDIMKQTLKSIKASMSPQSVVKLVTIKASNLTQKKVEKMLIEGDYAEKVFDKFVKYREDN